MKRSNKNIVFAAAILTIAIIYGIYGLFINLELLHRLQKQVDDITTQSRYLKSEIVSYAETKDMLKAENLELKKSIKTLVEKVNKYEQDIRFWNDQVNNMFGEHNARYFREERGE